jgi:hypothetical protein
LIGGYTLTSAQKFSLSLLIAVVAFAGFVFLAYSGLFSYIETTFFNRRVDENVKLELNTAVDVIENYHSKNLARLEAIISSDYIANIYQVNQSRTDIFERENSFGKLKEEIPELTEIRFFDQLGEKLHYSSVDRDIKKRTEFSISYKPIKDLELDFIIEDFLLSEGSQNSMMLDNESKSFIYQFPIIDVFGVFKGTGLFKITSLGMKEILLQAGVIDTSEALTFINSTGLLISSQEKYDDTIVQEITRLWTQTPEVYAEKLKIENDSGVKKILFSKRTDMFGVIGLLVQEDRYGIKQDMRFILLGTVFLTIFLLIFLFFNLRQDAVVVLSERVKKLQINLLREYVEKKEDLDWSKWKGELQIRREEVKKEIKKGVGRLKGKQEEEIDVLIDKNWDEILAIIGQGGPAPARANVDIENLEELIQKVVSNIQPLSEIKYIPVETKGTDEIKKATQVKKAQPVEVEELEELDELEGEEEIDAGQSFTAGMKPVEVETVSDLEDVDELTDTETTAVPESFTAGMKPVDVEEIEELDEIEEADEIEEEGIEAADITASDTTVIEPVEIEEASELEELEEIGELDEIETAEEAAVIGDSTGSEDIDELGELEEMEELESADAESFEVEIEPADLAETEIALKPEDINKELEIIDDIFLSKEIAPYDVSTSIFEEIEKGILDPSKTEAVASSKTHKVEDEELEELEEVSEIIPLSTQVNENEESLEELTIVSEKLEEDAVPVEALAGAGSFSRGSVLSYETKTGFAQNKIESDMPRQTVYSSKTEEKPSDEPFQEEVKVQKDLSGTVLLSDLLDSQFIDILTLDQLLTAMKQSDSVIEKDGHIFQINEDLYKKSTEPKDHVLDSLVKSVVDEDTQEGSSGIDDLFAIADVDLFSTFEAEPEEDTVFEADEEITTYTLISEFGIVYDTFVTGKKLNDTNIVKSLVDFTRFTGATGGCIMYFEEEVSNIRQSIGFSEKCTSGLVFDKKNPIYNRYLKNRCCVLIKYKMQEIEEYSNICSDLDYSSLTHCLFLPITVKEEKAYLFLGYKEELNSIEEILIKILDSQR